MTDDGEAAFTPAHLDLLAYSRKYSVKRWGDGFWLIDERTGLPEANDLAEGLTFSLGEAETFLNGISAVRRD